MTSDALGCAMMVLVTLCIFAIGYLVGVVRTISELKDDDDV